MSPWLLLPWIALALPPLFALGWLWQRRHGDASVVDLLWTLAVGGGGLVLLLAGPGTTTPRLLAAALLAAWTLRLGLHVLGRLRAEGAEDGRYAMLRARWGLRAQPMLFGFFQLQALFVLLFLPPFIALACAEEVPGWQLVAGTALWLLGFAGGTLADRQLQRWRRDPQHAGRTCRAGLWAWSRHPNYFCEWLLWLGYPLLLHSPALLLLALSTPAILLVLLLRVTGIPYAERRALATRGEDYRRYQREVPAFFPWPPRRRAGNLPHSDQEEPT